ncbi:hypothetical protein B4166_2657 [Caldibacillus thermoamylovorans]|uniref:Uncharacterized protein n=1 Tax=Caldibacillus thermoamylovorans TaxID=35841 RepID=A0ABD4A8C3_9BACI|nr:hypothetical protein B4166_2657 [Caldibacillus thermoamylovorans]KIO73311.1 hypothetical protein B4167_2235 [Caldibacillus thermoamylovorans]
METKERQQELKKLLVTTYFQVYTEKEMTLKKLWIILRIN